jgi:hypothetical protein
MTLEVMFEMISEDLDEYFHQKHQKIEADSKAA